MFVLFVDALRNRIERSRTVSRSVCRSFGCATIRSEGPQSSRTRSVESSNPISSRRTENAVLGLEMPVSVRLPDRTGVQGHLRSVLSAGGRFIVVRRACISSAVLTSSTDSTITGSRSQPVRSASASGKHVRLKFVARHVQWSAHQHQSSPATDSTSNVHSTDIERRCARLVRRRFVVRHQQRKSARFGKCRWRVERRLCVDSGQSTNQFERRLSDHHSGQGDVHRVRTSAQFAAAWFVAREASLCISLVRRQHGRTSDAGRDGRNVSCPLRVVRSISELYSQFVRSLIDCGLLWFFFTCNRLLRGSGPRSKHVPGTWSACVRKVRSTKAWLRYIATICGSLHERKQISFIRPFHFFQFFFCLLFSFGQDESIVKSLEILECSPLDWSKRIHIKQKQL